MIKTNNLTFGEASAIARKGLAVAREEWLKNTFAYIIPWHITKPLPGVEEEYFGKHEEIQHHDHWRMKTIQDEIDYYNPSGSDVLANDWKIVLIKRKEKDI